MLLDLDDPDDKEVPKPWEIAWPTYEEPNPTELVNYKKIEVQVQKENVKEAAKKNKELQKKAKALTKLHDTLNKKLLHYQTILAAESEKSKETEELIQQLEKKINSLTTPESIQQQIQMAMTTVAQQKKEAKKREKILAMLDGVNSEFAKEFQKMNDTILNLESKKTHLEDAIKEQLATRGTVHDQIIAETIANQSLAVEAKQRQTEIAMEGLEELKKTANANALVLANLVDKIEGLNKQNSRNLADKEDLLISILNQQKEIFQNSLALKLEERELKTNQTLKWQEEMGKYFADNQKLMDELKQQVNNQSQTAVNTNAIVEEQKQTIKELLGQLHKSMEEEKKKTLEIAEEKIKEIQKELAQVNKQQKEEREKEKKDQREERERAEKERREERERNEKERREEREREKLLREERDRLERERRDQIERERREERERVEKERERREKEKREEKERQEKADRSFEVGWRSLEIEEDLLKTIDIAEILRELYNKEAKDLQDRKPSTLKQGVLNVVNLLDELQTRFDDKTETLYRLVEEYPGRFKQKESKLPQKKNAFSKNIEQAQKKLENVLEQINKYETGQKNFIQQQENAVMTPSSWYNFSNPFGKPNPEDIMECNDIYYLKGDEDYSWDGPRKQPGLFTCPIDKKSKNSFWNKELNPDNYIGKPCKQKAQKLRDIYEARCAPKKSFYEKWTPQFVQNFSKTIDPKKIRDNFEFGDYVSKVDLPEYQDDSLVSDVYNWFRN